MTLDPRVLQMIANPTGGKLGEIGQTIAKNRQLAEATKIAQEDSARKKTKFKLEMADTGSKIMGAYSQSMLDFKEQNPEATDQEFAEYQLASWETLEEAHKQFVPQGFQNENELKLGKQRAENIQKALHGKASEGFTLKPDEVRYDAAGNVIVEAKPKPEVAKVPTTRKVGEMVDGEPYVIDQEYDPETKDWKEVGRKKGAEGVTINTGQKEDQKFTYAELTKATDDARFAVKERQNLEYIKTAMSGIDTGMLTDVKISLSRLASSLDIPFDTGSIANLESATTAMGNLVMAGLNNFPGQISNEERKFVAGIMPKVTQTPKGREQIIEFLSRLSDRRVEYRKQMTKFVSKNKSLITDKTSFYDEWDKYEAENPVLKGLSLLNKESPENKYIETRTLSDGRRMGIKADGTKEFIE